MAHAFDVGGLHRRPESARCLAMGAVGPKEVAVVHAAWSRRLAPHGFVTAGMNARVLDDCSRRERAPRHTDRVLPRVQPVRERTSRTTERIVSWLTPSSRAATRRPTAWARAATAGHRSRGMRGPLATTAYLPIPDRRREWSNRSG